MKKEILTITLALLMTLSYSVQAQVNSLDFIGATTDYKMNGEETLFKATGKAGDIKYIIDFNKTPVGLKHCIEKVKEILTANSMDFDSPTVKNELIASYVNNIDDYSSFNVSLVTDASEMHRFWHLDNDYVINLSLSNKNYFIIIFNSKN
jgi:hypothetical protein